MIFDFIVAALLIYGFYRGFSKGFIKSLASFVSVFIGVILALNFSYIAAEYLEEWFNIGAKLLPLVSFVVVFILVLLLITVISNILDRIFNALMLGFLNKIAGGVLYAFLFAFLLSTLVWFVDKGGLIAEELKMESVTYSWLAPISPATVDTLGEWIPGLDNIFQSFEDLITDIKETKDKVTNFGK